MKCGLCKKQINTLMEKYVHLEDWEKENVVKEIWCHRQCFNKEMNRDLTDVEKKAAGMLNQLQPLLNQLTGRFEEYEIKAN